MPTAEIEEPQTSSALVLVETPGKGAALALIAEFDPDSLATPHAIDPIIEKIAAAVRAVPIDVTTEEGRREIASLAHKIARSKTFVDDQGKELVSETKAQIKAIDQERSRVWDVMEALQKEIRKPLTDWETEQKARVASHNTALETLRDLFKVTTILPVAELERRIAEVSSVYERDWEEFQKSADLAKSSADLLLGNAIESAKAAEAQQAELEQLRAQQAERDRVANEERIAREAVKKAQDEARERELQLARDAEAERLRIQREADLAVQRAQEAEATVERERAAGIERERLAAVRAEEERQAGAERERLAAIKAEEDRQAAVTAERERIEREQAKEREAALARERDKTHKATINRQICAALMKSSNLTESDAQMVVRAIAKGLISNVAITY
jgi:hypothetical protein